MPDESRPGEAARGFLEARRVALVGASGGRRDQWSYNARMTRSLLGSSFDEVVLVSRHDTEIGGLPAYASLGEAPGPAGDVCVLVVPHAGLAEAAADAAASGWRRLLIITGQLTDQDRSALSARVPEVRIWGPNCTGLIVAASNSRIASSDYRPAIRPGRTRIAVAGQSGGALGAISAAVEGLGLAVSHQLSTGEEIDLGVDDVLWYAAGSGATDGVVLFVEEARRPQRFLDAVAACQAASVPVVIVKVGRSRTAASAALTHSGALVGDWDEFEAAVAARGGVVCGSLREGAGVVALWAGLRRRPGRRTAFFTSSGGTGALACDVAETCGLPLAELSHTATGRLRQLVSEADGLNPFDSANGGGTPSTLPGYLEALAGETGVDTVVVLHSGEVYGDLIVDQLTGPARAGTPVVAVWPAAPDRLRDRLLDGGVPVTDDVADACRWLAAAAGPPDGSVAPRAAAEQTGPRPEAEDIGTDPGEDAASRLTDGEAASLTYGEAASLTDGEAASLTDGEAASLTYGEAVGLLDQGGIPGPWRVPVPGPDAIAAALAAVGERFPVVVKAAALRGHKARVGGVVGDVRGPAELATVLGRLTASFGPLVVEEQVAPGLEVLVAARAGRFGGVIVIGLGGRHADVLGRQVVLSRDATDTDVRARLAASVVGRLLTSDLGEGSGGRALDALAATAARVAAITRAQGLDSLEVNPVVMTADRLAACDAKAERAR